MCVVVPHFTFHQSTASSAIVSRRSAVLSGSRSIGNDHSSNATCTWSPSVGGGRGRRRASDLQNFDKRFVQVGRMMAAKLCDGFPSGGARAVLRKTPPLSALLEEQSDGLGPTKMGVAGPDGGRFRGVTPASPSRWTSPERWPPPGSDRSSAFSSLTRAKKDALGR